MNKQKQNNKLVPELRFPEFENDGEWEEIRLIDVTDKNTKWSFIGGPFGSNLKSSDYVTNNKGIRVIQLQNIGDGQFNNSSKIFTSEQKANELLSNNIYPGDIIMSKMGDPVGRACFIPNFHDRHVMCSDGIRLVVDEKKYDKYFIYTLINSNSFRSIVERTATGSTRKRIGLDNLKNLMMTVPKELEEQKKIADCLCSLDDLIGLAIEKLNFLKTHKKGLLQQLFPAEGETVPKLRFPEFENDGDWEITELGKCLFQQPEYGIGAPAVPFSENLPTYLRITDISEDGHFLYSKKVSVEREVTEDNYLDEGDIVFARTGASVGKSYKYRIKDGRLVFAGFLIRVKPDPKKLNSELLFQFVFSEEYWNWVKITSPRSGQPGINSKEYSLMPLILPSALIEQKKIANCLSSLDDLIEAQREKIEVLKEHKKGLMQQLFPIKN